MKACSSILKVAGHGSGGLSQESEWRAPKSQHLLQNSQGCGELGRFLDCSGPVVGLAGPGFWFCLIGKDLCLLRFRSGQEKGSFCGGRVMLPLLLVAFWFQVTRVVLLAGGRGCCRVYTFICSKSLERYFCKEVERHPVVGKLICSGFTGSGLCI